jgi:signal transduction histidine kinase
MVYGIVKRGGGHVQLSSELRKGTTFEIYLPLCNAPDPGPDDDSDPEPEAA